MQHLEKAEKALESALEHLASGNSMGANEQFAVLTTTMLNATDVDEKRNIAELAVHQLGEKELFALQPPFQQLLARLASSWTEAAKWVGAEGDALAKLDQRAAATVRCCIARTLARDEQLPANELVMGTLGVAGLCRDASALGNMFLWQELLQSLKLPQSWFDRNIPPASAPLLQYYYDEVSWPKLPEVLQHLQQAMAAGKDVDLRKQFNERQETVLSPLFTKEVQLINIEVGDEEFSGFIALAGQLCWLGAVEFTESAVTDSEILRLAKMGYTAGYTPEAGRGEEGFASWVEHILTKASAAGDFQGKQIVN